MKPVDDDWYLHHTQASERAHRIAKSHKMPKKVVIVGGGASAHQMLKALAGLQKNNTVEVTMIQAQPYKVTGYV